VNIVLAHGDRMLSRLGLAYAINMHQAQGMTTDQGIGVMHSAERHLSNQRLTHVMATRVRDDLTIYTNDRDALLRSIEANPGDKASALERREQRSPSQSSAPEGLRKSPSPSSTADRADQFAIDVATLREARQARGRSEAVDPCP
jgi:hypothetical protein